LLLIAGSVIWFTTHRWRKSREWSGGGTEA
jgi:hypothetical protein